MNDSECLHEQWYAIKFCKQQGKSQTETFYEQLFPCCTQNLIVYHYSCKHSPSFVAKYNWEVAQTHFILRAIIHYDQQIQQAKETQGKQMVVHSLTCWHAILLAKHTQAEVTSSKRKQIDLLLLVDCLPCGLAVTKKVMILLFTFIFEFTQVPKATSKQRFFVVIFFSENIKK